MNGLAQFLATVRIMSDSGYGSVGRTEGTATPFGAYGMWTQNWDAWSSELGLGGHDKFDPAAQDAVASFWGQKLFQRYGSWEMAAAAWFAGAEQTDRAAASSEDTNWFKHDDTKKWIKRYKELQETPEVQNATVPRAGAQWINARGAPKGWLSPIAGKNEYSNSFLVPRDNKSGIHGAIDLYAARGTPIVAPVGGKVLSTRKSDIGGYTVRVQGTDGLTYYFAHMDSAAVVKAGSTIQAGAHLGFVGNSGNARGTTPHLHFGVRRGNTLVNPYSYLQGAKNAGNYYAPDDTSAHGVDQRSVQDQYTSFLNTISQQVAGGERTDYRTLGLDEEVENPEEDEPKKLPTPEML